MIADGRIDSHTAHCPCPHLVGHPLIVWQAASLYINRRRIKLRRERWRHRSPARSTTGGKATRNHTLAPARQSRRQSLARLLLFLICKHLRASANLWERSSCILPVKAVRSSEAFLCPFPP